MAIAIYRQEVRTVHRQADRILVTNFAKQAVIAIENTRLLKELRERTDDLTRSLDDLRATQDRLVQTEKLASLGQLTAGIAHEIKNPLNFVNNFSALSAELTDELNDALKPVAMDVLWNQIDSSRASFRPVSASACFLSPRGRQHFRVSAAYGKCRLLRGE